MANWKVSAERIEISPHPNADAMEIAKVGMFQLVVGKGAWRSGDRVVFAPKRSVLPAALHASFVNTQTGASYLAGPRRDRVSSIRLRGELSEGVTLPIEYVLEKLGIASVDALELGKDLAEPLGISLYEPPMPSNFGGALQPLRVDRFATHDVEQMAIYAGELRAGEPIVATEKIHGSQCAVLLEESGQVHVSSKGFFAKGIEILEDETNLYWRAARNSRLVDSLQAAFPDKAAQAFAEVIPVQGGAWSYGASENKPTLRLFRVIVDGRELPIDEARSVAALAELWVPILHRGPFDLAALRPLAKGKEQVSGKQLHKREGLVITPVVPRLASEGFYLALKVVSPDFKDSDDATG